MGGETEQNNTIHGSVFRDKPASVKATRLLHRVLPVSSQRSFRDGAFRAVSDGGVAVVAGLSAVVRPRLAARFLSVGRQREDHRYGKHPRQVIEVVQPARESRESAAPVKGGEKRPKLIVFVHGGAWGSGCTWMYRLMVDRLCHSQLGSAYTVASIGYRVYPDADTTGQVDDLAEAMRWISGNIGTIGFDRDPEVYLMGHSSGAHIALLYLIRRAEEETEEETAARQHAQGLPGVDSATDIASRGGGDGDRGEVGDGGGRQYLEVEGFIGLAGVYDVYRHYLYESWRGVHEISPMKAANGGMLHTLFGYSHPHLLGGVPQPRHEERALSRPSPPRPRAPPPPPPPPPPHHHHHHHDRTLRQQPEARPTTREEEMPHTPSASRIHDTQGATGLAASCPSSSSSSNHHNIGSLGRDNRALSRRALGRRLPRSLLVHGTADNTVPFSQTVAVASTLGVLGVPTIVRFDPGGDHFGVVGQLMFEENSLVEKAISRFASQEAKDNARQSRANDDRDPPRLGHPHPRL